MTTMTQPRDKAVEFEQHRHHLFGVAYRMLGLVADAEDVVQEAWGRFEKASLPDNPRAWLTTAVTRLCIDRLRELKTRRETYVGPWLPEPLMTTPHDSAEKPGLLAESLTLAFMTLLEKLNPVERAVFLLREVFDYDFADIAAMVERAEANCRQILSRARQHLDAPARFVPAPAKQAELVNRFLGAVREGRMEDLLAMLTQDALTVGDGGGKRLATLHPLIGAQTVAKFWVGLARSAQAVIELRPGWFNSRASLAMYEDGELTSLVVFDFDGERIAAIHAVRNPDKLGRVPQS